MTVLSWIVYAVGVLADILSTRAALASKRGREGNLLRFVGDRWLLVRIIAGGAVAALTIGQPEPQASWVRLGLGLGYVAIAAWNWRVAKGN